MFGRITSELIRGFKSFIHLCKSINVNEIVEMKQVHDSIHFS